MSITHTFVSEKDDGADETLVRPSDWNADHTGGSAGAGHITILPYNYDSIGQGTWMTNLNAAHYTYGMFYNSPGNDGDNLLYKVYLAAGTYTILFYCHTESNRGITDVDIDAVEVASFDLYSATSVSNVRMVATGIVVASDGLKTLKFRVDGKNASSDGYYMSFHYIALWRTA